MKLNASQSSFVNFQDDYNPLYPLSLESQPTRVAFVVSLLTIHTFSYSSNIPLTHTFRNIGVLMSLYL